jgi:hypothetical protein
LQRLLRPFLPAENDRSDLVEASAAATPSLVEAS